MATVKNFNLAGVAENVQFGKAGGKIDFSGGAFTVTDKDDVAVELTAATPTAGQNNTLVATTAYVTTELANFNDDRIEVGDTSIVIADAGTGAITTTVDAGTVMVTNASKIDAAIQFSAANGTVAAPGLAFDGTTGEEAGFYFEEARAIDPDGTPASSDEYTTDALSLGVDGKELQTWYLGDGVTDPASIETQHNLGEIAMRAKGTGVAGNIDIRLVPQGTGQVYLGDSGSAASISSSDAADVDNPGEQLNINAGSAFAAGDEDGGSIVMTPGNGDGAGSDGTIQLMDDDGNAVMIFDGVDSANAYFQTTNASSGNVKIEAIGTDTDVSIELFAQNAGEVLAQTGYDAVSGTAFTTLDNVNALITGGADRISDTGDTTFVDTETGTVGEVQIHAEEDVTMTAASDIDMTATANINMGGVNLDASMTGTVDIDGTAVHLGGTGASDFSTTAASLTLQTITSGNLVVNSAGNLDMDAVGVTLDATAAIVMAADSASSFTTTTGDLTLDAAANLVLTGTTSLDLDSAAITVDATGAFDMNAGSASSMNVTGADLTMQTTTSGNVVLNPAGYIDASSNLISNVTDPASAQDAATKAYVDGVASGLDVKNSVRVAHFANLGLTGAETLDGVTLSTGDRVLVAGQSDAWDNGIYVANTAGAWTRSLDADNSPDAELTTGMFTFVEEGTSYGSSGWVATSPMTTGITEYDFATDDIVYSQFSGAGAYTNSGGVGITATQSGTDWSIAANTDDATIRVNGSDNLAVSGGATDVLNQLLLGGNGSNTDASWGYLGDLRDSGGLLTMESVATASAVNNFRVTGSASASETVTLAAFGTDTDISVVITPKGAGFVDFAGSDSATSLLSNVTDPVAAQDAATMQYVIDSVGAVAADQLIDEDSTLTLSDAGNTLTMTFDSSNTVFQVTGSLFDVDVAIQALDGSAGAPAYAFAGDLTTGLYNNGDAISFSSAGTGVLSIGANNTADITALITNGDITLTPNGTGDVVLTSGQITGLIDPVADDQAARKGYVDDQVEAATVGDVRTLKVTDFALNTVASTVAFGSSIPAGATVTRVTISNKAGSDFATTITIGIPGDLAKYMGTLDNDVTEGEEGLYVSELMDLEGSLVIPQITIAVPASTGADLIDIILEYRMA